MPTLPRLVGINHVALEVGDIEEALAFYGKIFRFTLRGRGKGQAFIDMGDQFLALRRQDAAPGSPPALRPGGRRPREVKALAQAAGATMVDGPFLDFFDPWGNRIEVVAYADIQFSKAQHVLRGMAFDGAKSAKAKRSSPTRAWRRRGAGDP